MALESSSSDFFPEFPNPGRRRGGGQRRSEEEESILLPNPSFFSNFQMPFLSFEEEITIRDSNTSSPFNPQRGAPGERFSSYGGRDAAVQSPPGHNQGFYHHEHQDYDYEDDEDEGEEEGPMVLSDFGNVSMVVGASQFFDQLDRMVSQEPLMNETGLQELERKDFMGARKQPQFSVYRITTDGRTPFEQVPKYAQFRQ